MDMVMHVTIISMVMNSVAKSNTNMNNPVTMVMPVTMTVQRDKVHMVMHSVTMDMMIHVTIISMVKNSVA